MGEDNNGRCFEQECPYPILSHVCTYLLAHAELVDGARHGLHLALHALQVHPDEVPVFAAHVPNARTKYDGYERKRTR